MVYQSICFAGACATQCPGTTELHILAGSGIVDPSNKIVAQLGTRARSGNREINGLPAVQQHAIRQTQMAPLVTILVQWMKARAPKIGLLRR